MHTWQIQYNTHTESSSLRVSALMQLPLEADEGPGLSSSGVVGLSEPCGCVCSGKQECVGISSLPTINLPDT